MQSVLIVLVVHVVFELLVVVFVALITPIHFLVAWNLAVLFAMAVIRSTQYRLSADRWVICADQLTWK
mgnify:CR=1 FL=1